MKVGGLSRSDLQRGIHAFEKLAHPCLPEPLGRLSAGQLVECFNAYVDRARARIRRRLRRTLVDFRENRAPGRSRAERKRELICKAVRVVVEMEARAIVESADLVKQATEIKRVAEKVASERIERMKKTTNEKELPQTRVETAS